MIILILIIQEEWIIDEYARIDLKFFCFILNKQAIIGDINNVRYTK